MQFLHPELLWWLAALPVLFAIWRITARRIARARARFEDFAHVDRLSRATSSAQEALRGLLLGGVFVALILAVAQPRLTVEGTRPIYRRQDVIFLLDASPSMRARDVHPSRIERAKEEVRNFVGDRGGLVDRLGLVTFTGSAVITSFLTRDLDNIPFYLDFMDVQPKISYGTSFSAALSAGLTLLKKEAEAAEREKREDPNQKLFIILSDGEDFGAELEDAIGRTIAAGIKVYAIGIGSDHDVPIPIKVGEQETLLRDESGAVVSARFDESSLRRIASLTGGRYYRSFTGAQLSAVVAQFLVSGREVAGRQHISEPVDLYPKFLMSGALLLGLTLLI